MFSTICPSAVAGLVVACIPCRLKRRSVKASTAAISVRMYSGGQWHEAALVVREDMRPGDVVPGPAIVREPLSTTHICQGQIGKGAPVDMTRATAEMFAVTAQPI